MSVRFVVPADGVLRVCDVLERLGQPMRAVAEGRVFVERRRVENEDDVVRPGNEVVVEEPRPLREGARVLSEWRSLHAAWKPPGLPTEPDRRGHASLVHAVAAELRVPPSSLHAATRLDADASGIVVLALGSEAMRLVAALKGSGALRRRYVAIASRAVDPRRGVWDAPIARGVRGLPATSGKSPRRATTRYQVVALADAASHGVHPALFVVEPATGRTHQIRVHAAAAGAPLLGDVDHGGLRRVVDVSGRVIRLPRLALHAARIEVVVDGRIAWSVSAPHAEDLLVLWAALGGVPRSFDEALELPVLDAR